MVGMARQVLNKHQLRTRETEQRLLNAAEEIFVRDGYEGAQLEEIAAIAGRTKGAVYAHFESKEDLFLALFERRTREYVDRLIASLTTCTTRRQSLEAFRGFYVSLASDRAWPILTLEFKLFSLRHPGSKERLRKAYEMITPAGNDSFQQQVFGSLSPARQKDHNLALLSLGPIVSGLMLDSHFEPEVLTENALRRILGRVFDALFPG